jgi:hypothetical protein
MRYKVAYRLFELERERQRDLGWTEEHDRDHHSVPNFLLMMEKQLQDAKNEWYRSGDSAALTPLVQLGAMVTACIETQYEDDVSDER